MDFPNTYLLISCSEHLLNVAFFFILFFKFYFVWRLAKCSYVCLSKNCSVKKLVCNSFNTTMVLYPHKKKKKYNYGTAGN